MGELTCRTLHAHTFFKNTKSKSKAARVDRNPKLPNAVPEGHYPGRTSISTAANVVRKF